jgi:hypothetical protein
MNSVSASFALLDFTSSKLKHKMHEIFILGKSKDSATGSTPDIHLASRPTCSDLVVLY